MKLNVIDPSTGSQVISGELTNGLIEIGRKSRCTVHIPDRYGAISGVHVTLRSSGGAVEIIDGDGVKASGNGLFVNGKRVPQEIWVRIKDGDQVSLGIPGATGSLALVLRQKEVNNNSQTRASRSAQTSSFSSYSRLSSQTVASKASGNRNATSYCHTFNRATISPSMGSRLDRIDRFLNHGYSLEKSYFAPVFISNDGRKLAINIFSNNPAGFSWMGFFFGFAVFTQIREWSYFYVIAAADVVASVLSVALNRDITFGVSLAISVMYGMYFPYLRHVALNQGVHEIGKLRSIIQGILLSVLAVTPGSLLTYLFLPQ